MPDNTAADSALSDPLARIAIVRSAWLDVLGVAEVNDDATFFDSGGDSLRLVILAEKLNETTGRALRTVDLFRAGTVRGHADLLAGAAASSSEDRGSGRERLLRSARRPAPPARPGIPG